MDPIWLTIAFILGFLMQLAGLPPLVGYLIAGFVLNTMGASTGGFIEILSDLGVTLLLFTIGLKVKLRNLSNPEVYGGTLIHMAMTTLLFGTILTLVALNAGGLFEGFGLKQAILVAFALSFSSTVFAVKVLEDRGESTSLHGTTAIGILIIQDLIAVVFLVATSDQLPSVWVFTLPLALAAIKPLVFLIFKKIGHGELLILFGFFLALVPGAEMFRAFGLKPDLGALVMGILISSHPRAREMAESLLHFKDLFLIGFFLSIGLSVTPTMPIVMLALAIAVAINFKVIMYFGVFTRFGLRARTSYFTSLSLANYSEFGLIVAAVAASTGWLSADWLAIMAIALSISFFISSPLNSYAHRIYEKVRKVLIRFETKHRLLYDRTIDIGDAEVLIFGMGLLGTSTYDHLLDTHGQKVLGLDYNADTVNFHRKSGRNVIKDDATDLEFWEMVGQMTKQKDQVKLVVLCMEDHKSNLFAVDKLKSINFMGRIAATARHDDEIAELRKRGVDSAYNLYAEAGIGLADHICST